MKIALCTPFKPMDHPSVSGDVTIARDLAATLRGLGVEVIALPYFPAARIWLKPWRWLGAVRALSRMIEAAKGADAWLTVGTYYKVPDIFGPCASRRLSIPYAIFQASYAAKRRNSPVTWGGYRLNRRAMLRADHLFINRANDLAGCAKLLPPGRSTHIRPGLPEGLFARDETARTRLREAWRAGDARVVITAAMMRAGVKARGLEWVFDACAELLRRGRDIRLIVAGDGPLRGELEPRARALLGERVRFLGLVDRADLAGVFSAGDCFAFPGLKESVGMVYLEAQQCGLPVVATNDEGAPHVVSHGRTGLITEAAPEAFTEGLDTLVRDDALRAELGSRGPAYVIENHNTRRNYQIVVDVLRKLAHKRA